MVDLKYTNKKWLNEQYIIFNKSSNEISKEFGFSQSTILNWLKKFNIKKEVQKTKKNQIKKHNSYYKDKKWLNEQYIILNKSTRDIAKEFNLNRNTILNWIKKFNIKKDNTIIKSQQKQKAISTFNQKYGTSNPMQNKKICAISTKEINKDEVKLKAYLTKKRNGSFKKSKQEKVIYKYLKQYYPNIISQYKSQKYPFNCDYYIPELDLYVEYNGNWGHYVEPFDKNNKKHQLVIKNWKEKAKEINFKKKKKSYYLNSIYTFTKLDPKKRKTAKDNNIKYLELWSKDFKKGLKFILKKIHKFV